MSRYKAYAEYKDSGVEWLGSIPKSWGLTRIKYIAELTPGKPSIRRELECSFIPMEKLKTNSIVLDEVRLVDDVYDGYTYFRDGDILMAKVTPCFENKNIAIADGLTNKIGFGSSEIYVIRVNEVITNRYWFYRLQEDTFMDIATAAMTGAGGLRRVPSDVVKNFIASLPPISEQQKIANFLDHETAKIDTLIAKQQELIKLLKEKRRAVISHAVTKGINPNAPMRDSGVEWLGEVPVHWKVSPLKWYASIKSGENISANEIETIPDENTCYPVFGGNGILGYAKKYNLTNATIVIGRVGALCGNVHKVKDLSWVSDNALIINLDNLVLNLEFVSLCLGARDLNTLADKNAQPLITGTKVTNECIPVPPIEEQNRIEQHVNQMMNQYELLSSRAELGIVLLNERRTALISAAVTGKIDVRDWQAPSDKALAA